MSCKLFKNLLGSTALLFARMAYDGHIGVRYRRYADNHEPGDEPEEDTSNASLDELHFSSYSGELQLTVETPEGYIGIDIPVKADKSWNGFVESLPKWELDQ